MKTTIKEVANMIANEFNEDVIRFECENFKEMKRRFDWDAEQIRNEIEYMLNHTYGEYGVFVREDSRVCNFNNIYDEDYECTYGTFKKMVFANVK